MNCSRAVCFLSFVVLAAGAPAQTAVTTSGGTTNTVPVFTGSATVGNSPITVNSGNVGIGGSASPSSLLYVYSSGTSEPLTSIVSHAGGTGLNSDIFDVSNTSDQVLSGNAVGISAGKLAPGYGALNITAGLNPTSAMELQTGNIVGINFTHGFTGGSYTQAGHILSIARNNLIGASGNTINVTGALAAFSNAASQGSGTITDSSNILQLSQAYSNATGTVLAVSNAGTGYAATFQGGNVGIGTTSPAYKLDVGSGQVNSSGGYCIAGSCITAWPNSGVLGTVTSISAGAGLSGGTITNTGTLSLNLANSNTWTGAQTFNAGASFPGGVWNSNGNVGIGTTSPAAVLDVNGVIQSNASVTAISPNNSLAMVNMSWLNNIARIRYGGSGTGASNGLAVEGISDAVKFFIGDNAGINVGYATTAPPAGGAILSGNVGIGTTAPGAKLEVNGNVKLTSGSGASVTYADGSVQTTAWNGVLNGGDYAEDMRATGSKKKYEPGDVLVLASGESEDVQKSAEPYSTLVAGILATKPGVVGRREEVAESNQTIPMAMVGVVPTKVIAENGPIHKGDLLVTSSTAGYAMKGTDRSRLVGAVLGKAMGSLDSGTGVIEVLVTLQ